MAMPLEEEDEDEERELVEVMEEVEFEREWRVCWVEGTDCWLSGELGQEFWGDVGGVGRMGGRSAGVSCMTLARGDIGTPAHSPSVLTTSVAWGTMLEGYGGGRCRVRKSKGLSISTSAEGGGVA